MEMGREIASNLVNAQGELPLEAIEAWQEIDKGKYYREESNEEILEKIIKPFQKT
ncbi:MAG: hypothetical protein LBD61_03430 [Endomicrobium sp.]|jgi:hypothetical protein|nr:hypothetical protein [Endomicrobium sp.]